jgi:maltooligosyltrehalose trehalohydrolase
MNTSELATRLPIGAEPWAGGGTWFRVWAPGHTRVHVVLEGTQHEEVALEREAEGYFAGIAASAEPGTLYRFRLDGDSTLYPDPASRFQPEGPHGPSQVIDPAAYRWSDYGWRGCGLEGQVIYEMHIGTFTREGTWQAALDQLPELAELGITVLEIMPVAEFPGRFGWGYDGVDLFAPTRLYGRPDDFRQFVDRAHQLGMGVILDVVYNHLGPDGNYLKVFSPDYFSKRYSTDWGEAINFDGKNCGPVREFFLANVDYWIDEFHLDGLRIDATQNIYDASEDHILAAITRRMRQAAGDRRTLVIAENEPQDTRLVRPAEAGGYGMDALWNDDFHHSAIVLLSGRNEAYYSDYGGTPQEFISAAKYGYLYQGQWYEWQKKRRGTSTAGLPPAAFVNFIQNHDQVANTGLGRRCHTATSPGRYKAMTALMLLMPGTPMLFQGQEFASSSPFFYFADHQPELAALIDKGRKEFIAQFPSLARPEVQAEIPHPSDEATFETCKLNFDERQSHQEIYALHRDLLRLRREEPVFRAQRPGGLDGAVLGDEAFVLRFFGEAGKDGQDRLLLVNFGSALRFSPAPEPLLAPPAGCIWEIRWSSEDLGYGGSAVPPVDGEENWRIPGHAALVLASVAGSGD